MKSVLKSIEILIFATLITVSKQDLCPNNEINIDPLGNICVAIEDFLEKEDLLIKPDNLLYLATNNGGIINKNNYILEFFKLSDEKLQSFNLKKSKIYISDECLKAMEESENIKLDKYNSIIVIIYNFNQITQNNLQDIYFIIRQSSPNSKIKYINSKYFDFSLCHKDPIYLDNQINITELKYELDDETPIDIEKITYAKKLKIDLFDPHSNFLNDICFKFTSENKKDVPLDSRFEDYYQNITLCNESLSSHYIGFNYSSIDKMLSFRCAYGFYKDEEDKKSYIDSIDDKMKFIFKTSNIKVITCFEELLNLREFIYNYGGFICVFVFILQVILYISYSCKGTHYLEEEIQEMFDNAEKRKRLKALEVKTTEQINEVININNDLNTNERLQNSKYELDNHNKETIIENNKDNEEGKKENIVIADNIKRNNLKKRSLKKRKSMKQNLANPNPKYKTKVKKAKKHDNFDLNVEDEKKDTKFKKNK